MRRCTAALLLACAGLLLAASAAPAVEVRLGRGADVVALTVAGGEAAALLSRGGRTGPATVVRSDGRRVRRGARTGDPHAEYHALAGDGSGRLVAAWDHSITGGFRYLLQGFPGGSPAPVAFGTGPVRLAVGPGGSALLAHPDRAGDIAVTTVPDGAQPGAAGQGAPSTVLLTRTAPHERHFAVALGLRPAGPLVLDLAQRRRRSELRVVGQGAPARPLVSVRRLEHLQGAMAVSRDRIAVAYVSRGRPVLATARPGGGWTRTVLSGRGVSGAPAVALAGSRAVVAWSQPGAGGRRDVHVATVGSRTAVRPLTRSIADDGPPLLAAAPSGRVYAAWTSVSGSAGTALLRRVR